MSSKAVRFSLRLTGCRRATVSEPIRDGDVQKAVQKAVFTLHAQLKRRPVPMPTKTEASSHSASVSTELATVGTAAPMGSFAWYDSTLGWIFMGLSGTVLVAGAVTHSNEVVSAGGLEAGPRDAQRRAGDIEPREVAHARRRCRAGMGRRSMVCEHA